MGTFRPGQNCWRIEHADRAAILIDAGAFFGAVRSALLQAKRSVFIVGWDLDSRTRLVGEDCAADDGWPVTLREFLVRLVRERPELTVHLLAWDFAVLYALEREPFPSLKLGWNTPSRIRFRLDNALPVGASHHQKIIVVDDAVAFSGGLDLTIRRWDTCQHDIDNPDRCDPAGQPYRPFHDVQMVVDGAAARALADIAHARWARVTGERIPVRPEGSASHVPWPDVTPDFTDAKIAIARTLPEYEDQQEVREVEALFCDMIASAERTIYIENQFLTCAGIAKALVKRLKEKPGLEVLMIAPHTPDTWLESHTMRNGRIRFWRTLQEAGVGDRVRLVCPEVRDGERVTHTMVHSKVMIIDDRLLRIGSANLNRRSMGTDSECDLALEARNDAERAAIRRVRARLLADHCGVAAEAGRAGAVRLADPRRRHAERARPSSHTDRRRRAGQRRTGRIHRGHRRSGAADPEPRGRGGAVRRPLPVAQDREVAQARADPARAHRARHRVAVPAAVEYRKPRADRPDAHRARRRAVGAAAGARRLHRRRADRVSGHDPDRRDRGGVRPAARARLCGDRLAAERGGDLRDRPCDRPRHAALR